MKVQIAPALTGKECERFYRRVLSHLLCSPFNNLCNKYNGGHLCEGCIVCIPENKRPHLIHIPSCTSHIKAGEDRLKGVI